MRILKHLVVGVMLPTRMPVILAAIQNQIVAQAATQ
jgi:hypothetical protein